MRKFTAGLYLVPILIAVDLGAKFWAIQNLGGIAEAVPLAPGLSLRLVSNPGVSFGLFAGSPWPVTLVTAAMTIALMVWFARSRLEREYVAIGSILAGASSNLIDRLINGAVTDFLSFGGLDAPLFTNNLADIWITVGVVILFGGALLELRKTVPVRGNHPS
ncbi:lipoprotein signal peptidase [Devosia pacifica]|uniref:Lipoprotein signal peptidase n=1 Tax=Devosia pacifica TaxID=1335967 RepID=A0A918SH35_9HYPH|nr:signal peptidase II [Devosia pacifica]GHA38879.1 lipoprotein signal peptidase [Devosia pacifica]